MLIDLNQAEADIRRDTEICVIGAGVAGITAVRRLVQRGHTVMLLESGGFDYEPFTAALNAGESVGQPYYDLEDARLRLFGGTTAIWGGRLAELDPIDFRARPWAPHSGWPIRFEELKPYYAEARPLFGLAPKAPGAADLAGWGLRPPDFDPSELTVKLWSFDRRHGRFTFPSSADVVEHRNSTVVLHATATDFEPAAGGGAVDSVVARAKSGRKLTVTARAFVLAAGGIENARLLLASGRTLRGGLGDGYDQVGRYFMEHPHARGGRMLGPGAWSLLKLFGQRHAREGSDIAALIAPSEVMQEREGVLNSSLTIAARQPPRARQSLPMAVYSRAKHDLHPTRRGRALWIGLKGAATWAQRRADPLRPWLLHRMGLRDVSLVVRAEQSPNPDSRIRLTDQADAFGVPRVALDWRTSALDIHSVERLVLALDRELRRLKLGRVEPSEWLSSPENGWITDPLISAHPIGGYHHIGVTRMSADPAHGVVDAEGRVHGVGNLYVVGSSVFPTSGWANPTLTIAALTLRTSDRLSQAINRRRLIA